MKKLTSDQKETQKLLETSLFIYLGEDGDWNRFDKISLSKMLAEKLIANGWICLCDDE